jgi:hypothetical protein
MAPPPNKEKKINKGKPPPIDKLIVPAIGLAIGIVAFQFIKGIISADVSDIGCDIPNNLIFIYRYANGSSFMRRRSMYRYLELTWRMN